MSKRGWPRVKFGEVVSNVNCVERDAAAAGLERVVGLEHLEPGSLKIKSWNPISDGTSFSRKFVSGQVLFGKRRAYQRKVGFAEWAGICSGDILTFESKDPKVLAPELLPFIVRSEGFFEHALGTSAGSLSPRTSWGALKNFEFPLPPKDEQKRIADILWASEETLAEANATITHLETLRRNLLNDLMQGKISVITPRCTNMGELPQHWKIVKISEAGKVQLGRQRAPQYNTGKFSKPYLRVANVFDGFLDLSDVLEMDFGDKDFASYSLKDGDILLNEGQSRELVGRAAMYHGEIKDCCFQNTLIRFRAGEELDPNFALLFFQYAFYRGTFAAVASQTTSIAHLGADRFGNLEMPIPPLEEQRRIVTILSCINEGLETCRKHYAATQSISRDIGEELLMTLAH